MDVMVIKEGTIVTPYSMYQADVKVVDGVITAIAKDIEPEGTVIDAKGKLVLPGAVDVHTHLELPFNGTTSADDYYDGTVAAAFGGTTTVFNYLNQIKGESLHDRYLRDKQSAEKKACIDYAREQNIERIIIVSNRKCVQAVRLYRKFGFIEMPVEKEKFPFERADIAFEMFLQQGN